MEEGAALPVMEMSWDFRSAETFCMPVECEKRARGMKVVL